MVWGGRWEGGSGWGARVHSWWIHVDIWQNQYNIVKLKNKIKLKKKNEYMWVTDKVNLIGKLIVATNILEMEKLRKLLAKISTLRM